MRPRGTGGAGDLSAPLPRRRHSTAIPYFSEVIESEPARKDVIATSRGKPATHREREPGVNGKVLGAGLEPACLSAYAPQTYVSAIPPPERMKSDW